MFGGLPCSDSGIVDLWTTQKEVHFCHVKFQQPEPGSTSQTSKKSVAPPHNEAVVSMAFLGWHGMGGLFVHSKWIPSFWYNLSPAPTTQLGLDDFWFWVHSHPSHEWLIFLVNVGKYAGDMDPMGLKLDEVGTGCTSSISCNSRWVATKPCPSTTTEASFVGPLKGANAGFGI